MSSSLFDHHSLVESPRRVQFEKTTLYKRSNLSTHLDMLHDQVTHVDQSQVQQVHLAVTSLKEYLLPRIQKLGYAVGIHVHDIKFIGSTFDGTQTISMQNIDCLIIFKPPHMSLKTPEAGYRFIPLKRHRTKDKDVKDPYRFGRSEDGIHLSPVVVSRTVHSLVERGLKLHPTAVLDDLAFTEGSGPIVIHLDALSINMAPAFVIKAEGIYLACRPFEYDTDAKSDALWRVYHTDKEQTILACMDNADRGVRKQAYRLLKTVIKVEPTLHGLTTYMLKSILFKSFDNIVDSQIRWQKDCTENCFMDLVEQLCGAFSRKHLPNFYDDQHNLLEHMSEQQCNRLYARLCFLMSDQWQILRIIKKNTNKDTSKQ